MIIYKNDVQGFRNAVDNNRIVPDIVKERENRGTTLSNSWKQP